MEYRIEQTAAGIEVFLSGKLTMRDHEDFTAMLDRVSGSEGSRVALNLADVEFMDSAGLGLMLVAREQIRAAGKEITLRKPQSHVLQLLELGDFRRIIPIEA